MSAGIHGGLHLPVPGTCPWWSTPAPSRAGWQRPAQGLSPGAGPHSPVRAPACHREIARL